MFVKAGFLVPLLLASLIFGKGNRSGKKKGPGRCPRKIIVTSGHTGTIKTPGYPQFYKIRQICLWRIKVLPGYGVHLDFHDKFGVDCTSKDQVAVSSRRLFFKPKPSGSKTTAILCGTSQISNVTVPDRDMWVRFQAHRKETRGIGFKATYRSLDNDECESRHGCQQNCINTPGSYRCSCNSGYQLAKNGYNCTVIPKYEVKFERDSYVIPVSQGIPKNTRVLKARAYVKGQNKRIRYSIKGRYPKPHILKKYPFYISPDSGEITSSRRLPAGIFEYRMTVKAEVNSKSHAKATVVFNVNTASPNIKRVKFSSPRYSVIIADNLKRGDTVLNLSISPATALHYLIYNISERNRFFLVSKDLGSLKVKQDLSELKLSKNSSRRFLFTIVARHRERTVVAASVVVTVIVIPAHSGDIYGKLAPTKKIDFSSGKARKKPKRSEFAFHRFFRQLSPIAQGISKAERKFDKDIRSIRESVVEAYTDRRLRSSGPVIANLPPISLASRDKLQELINASHCVIPKADCSNVTYHSQYRTFDGTCNNLKNPLWGAANMPFSRIIPAKYWDTEGRGEPIGFPDQEMVPNMPSPHLVSKEYVLHRTSTARNDNAFSHMMMQWGQFLDHDITFTAESEGSELCAVPR